MERSERLRNLHNIYVELDNERKEINSFYSTIINRDAKNELNYHLDCLNSIEDKVNQQINVEYTKGIKYPNLTVEFLRSYNL